MRRNSLAFRLVASAAVWCALWLSAGGYALSALFGNTVERNFDARLGVLLEGLVAGSELKPDGWLDLRRQLGEPRFDQPLSGWYWQIEDRGRILRRSPSLWDAQLPLAIAPGELTAAQDVAGPDGQPLRLLVRAIILPGADGPLLYAVAGDRREIQLDRLGFNRLLSLALGVMFVGVIGAVLVQVRFGLEPLRRMGRALGAIRGGATARLEGAFPAEIEPLATELNALLDHNEALVERARTHVGNLAHGLKTPLSVLTNEAGRSQGPLAELVGRQVALMRRQVDHHLARARAIATGSILGARTDVLPVLRDLERTLERIYADRALAIELACAPELAFRGARQDLEEMLGNLLDNACKWAAASVAVRVSAAPEQVLRIAIEDDGPGLPASRRAEVLERGRRLDEQVPGTGLGLAIVADLAQLYGGRLVLDAAPAGGLRALLILPAAETLAARRAS
ncbi:MAG TPA: sensor histidine kinase [Geminicoccaceae bacterium]|jgi:signal transduction histidine kinase|nr:sensor histidine kinase [Geminicoccaceae bacterium]